MEYYKNDENFLVEVLLYFRKLVSKNVYVTNSIDNILKNMNRCIYCGEKLQSTVYKNVHTELDGNIIEYESVDFCPNCDIGVLNSGRKKS